MEWTGAAFFVVGLVFGSILTCIVAIFAINAVKGVKS